MDLFKSILQLCRGRSVGWTWRTSWTGDTEMIITIKRTSKTMDGIFGSLSLDWDPFTCVTCENLQKEIPVGVYPVVFNYSPHFDRIMPHLIVPGHTFIMLHPANYPQQLEGCIAVGQKVDGDAIDTSDATFEALNKILNSQAGMKVEVIESYT